MVRRRRRRSYTVRYGDDVYPDPYKRSKTAEFFIPRILVDPDRALTMREVRYTRSLFRIILRVFGRRW